MGIHIKSRSSSRPQVSSVTWPKSSSAPPTTATSRCGPRPRWIWRVIFGGELLFFRFGHFWGISVSLLLSFSAFCFSAFPCCLFLQFFDSLFLDFFASLLLCFFASLLLHCATSPLFLLFPAFLLFQLLCFLLLVLRHAVAAHYGSRNRRCFSG